MFFLWLISYLILFRLIIWIADLQELNMKLSNRLLKALSYSKGMGKIKDYQVIAGGVLIDFNDNSSVIARSIEEIKKVLVKVEEAKEWKK